MQFDIVKYEPIKMYSREWYECIFLDQLKYIVFNYSKSARISHLKSKFKYLIDWINFKTPLLSNQFYMLSTKINWILTDRSDFPTCPICNKQFGFDKNLSCAFWDTHGQYHKCCSVKCAAIDVSRVDKIKQTKLDRYGNENYNNVDKSRRTCLDRYNTTSYSQTNEYKTKVANTCNERYGGIGYASKELREKSLETTFKRHGDKYYRNEAKALETIRRKYGNATITNISQLNEVKLKKEMTTREHYGVNNPFQADEIKERIRQQNIDNYGVENVFAADEIKDKIAKTKENHATEDMEYFNKIKSKAIETNVRKYGAEWFTQTSTYHKTKRHKYEFNGMLFDSSWEVKVAKYCTENNIDFEYQPSVSFEYEYDGKTHLYFPDFKIRDRLYEVKGDHFFDEDGHMQNPYDHSLDGLYEAKHQCMIENDVIILNEAKLENLSQCLK